MSKSDWEEMIPNHRERVLPWEREQIPKTRGTLSQRLKADQEMKRLIARGRWWYTIMAPVRLIKAHPWTFTLTISSLVVSSFLWYNHQKTQHLTALRDFSQQHRNVLDICVEESQRACDVFIGAQVFYDCSAEVYQTCESLMELTSQLGSEQWQADRYLWEREDAFDKQVTSMTSLLTQHLDNFDRMTSLLANPMLQGLEILPPYTDQKVTQVQAILEQHERNEPVVDDLQHRLDELYSIWMKYPKNTLFTDEVLKQVERVMEQVQPLKMQSFGETLIIEQQIRNVGEHLEISVYEPDLSVLEDTLFRTVLRGEMNVLIGHSSLAFTRRSRMSINPLDRFPTVSNPSFSKLDLEAQVKILNTIDGKVSEQSLGVWDKWVWSDSTATPIDLDQVLASTELSIPWYTGRGSEYQYHLSEQERLALQGQKKIYQGDIEASVSLFETSSVKDSSFDVRRYISQRFLYSEVYQHSDNAFALSYYCGYFTDSINGVRGCLRLTEAYLNVECEKRSDKCWQALSGIRTLSLMSNLPEKALSKIDQHLIRLIEVEKVSPSLSTFDLCDLPTDWLKRHPHKPYRDWLSSSIQHRLEKEQDALTPTQFQWCQDTFIDLQSDLELTKWKDERWSLELEKAASLDPSDWAFFHLIQMVLNQRSYDRFEDIYQVLMSIEQYDVRGKHLRKVAERSVNHTVPKDNPVEWIAFLDKVFVSYKEFLSGIETVSDRAEHQIKLLKWIHDNDVGNVKEYLETTQETIATIETVSDRAEHQIKLLKWMNGNDVGNVKEYLETTQETIATIEDIHIRVAKQLKVVQWMRDNEDCISCDREAVASERRVQLLNTVANWLNNQTASDVTWRYKDLAIAFADEEKFDQAIKMKDKAWFKNVIAETSVEVAKRLHQHDPTDSRIQSLVSDAIQLVNDANWTGDFGTSHVHEYIHIIEPLQDMDWDHATLEDLRQRAVDVIDNIPDQNSQLNGVKSLMSSFEDQPVSPTIWSALSDKAYRVLASNDPIEKENLNDQLNEIVRLLRTFEGKPVSSTIWSALLDKAYRVLASSDSFDHSKVESLWRAIPLGLQYQYAHLLLPEMLRILEPKRWTPSKVKRLRAQLQNHPYWYRVVDSPETDEIKMSSDELWNYDYTHLPTVESATHSRYRWVLDAPEIPLELSEKSQTLLKQGGLNPPPRCIRDSVVVGYTQSTLTHFKDALPRWVAGQELRGRAKGIHIEPTEDIKKWYGQVTTESSEDPCFVAFPFPLLTTDELTALETELTQYESDFAAMKVLRKRAKGLQVDTTKWQPPYDVDSYTKQVELAERLIEEMNGLISKAKTLHVDLKTTTINDVPVLQQPYQESVVKRFSAELTRIEGFITEWNTARTEAFKVGYTFPRTLPVDKMTQEVLNWHTKYISQTPTVRKLMRQFKMVTIPKGEFLYLDFDEPFVVDHSFKMGRTELTEEIYCVVLGLEATEDLQCRNNYPVSVQWPSAKHFMMVLSFQMGASCDASFEKCTNRYRLPLLTEWRYAASAKQNYYYAGSHNPYDVAWIDEGVMPVGMKKPNTWGLYDMSGNRSEWVDTLNPKENEGYRYQGAGAESIRDLTQKYNRNESYYGYNFCGIRLAYDTLSTNTVSWHQKSDGNGG